MSKNLSPEEKGKIRDEHGKHPLLRLATQSCKRYESEMKIFRFSPEDVFWETLAVLDDLKAPDRDNDDLCDTLWDDLYCDFRSREGILPEEELEKAVAVVMSMATYLLALTDLMRYNGLTGRMTMAMSEHFKDYLQIQQNINYHAQKIGIEELRAWMEEYMGCDTYLSEEVEDCLNGEETIAVESSRVFLSAKRGSKIDFIRVVNALYELGLFQDEQGGSITKKEVFTTMGRFVNMDLSDYDKDLSRSLTDSTALEKHLKIFNQMKEKMEEIFNSK